MLTCPFDWCRSWTADGSEFCGYSWKVGEKLWRRENGRILFLVVFQRRIYFFTIALFHFNSRDTIFSFPDSCMNLRLCLQIDCTFELFLNEIFELYVLCLFWNLWPYFPVNCLEVLSKFNTEETKEDIPAQNVRQTSETHAARKWFFWNRPKTLFALQIIVTPHNFDFWAESIGSCKHKSLPVWTL